MWTQWVCWRERGRDEVNCHHLYSNSIRELSKVKLNKMTTTPFAKCKSRTNDQMAKNNTIYTCIIFICLLENYYVRTMHAGLMISSVNKFNFICVCIHGWYMTHFHIALPSARIHPHKRTTTRTHTASTSSPNEIEQFVNQVFKRKKLQLSLVCNARWHFYFGQQRKKCYK